jgi:UDP-N-acetylglucosamine:LPS N-acetylglucosamine transferase
MEKHQAAVVMTDEQADQELRLGTVIAELLENSTKLQQLSKSIYRQAHPGSAQEVAKLLSKYQAAKENKD